VKKIGSLCSGIGGLELGLERAMLTETVWQSEIDPYASQVLGRHWDVPNLGDMTTVDWTTVEPVDILCAGYPCQPFSHAGRRQGTADVRHLWPAVRDAIRHLGPGLVVLENVRGHLSLGFGEVLGDLADLGFDAEWRMLRASDIGAPHQRARLFVAAWHTDSAGSQGLWERSHEVIHPGQPAPVPSPSHDRPTPTDPGSARRDTRTGLCSGDEGTNRRGFTDNDDRQVEWGPYAAAVSRWAALTRPAPPPTDNGRLSPQFVEWMMGFPEGWVDGLPRSAALRVLGNAVHPWVSELFARTIAGEQATAADPLEVLLPTPTANQPGGSIEDYHGRLTDRQSTFVPLNMVVEQVLR
jgi:DNA (cytosine-5)-methyltransferase 1